MARFFYPKLCACGCGKFFYPYAPAQKYHIECGKAHVKIKNDRNREAAKRRRICRICRQHNDRHETRLTCSACAANNINVINAWKKAGLCTTCRTPKPNDGKATCDDCLEMHAKTLRKKRRNRLDMGLCVTCGINKHRKGKYSCLPCAMRRREFDRAYRKRAAA